MLYDVRQYVGQTLRTIQERFQGHFDIITSTKNNIDTPVGRHFCQPDHKGLMVIEPDHKGLMDIEPDHKGLMDIEPDHKGLMVIEPDHKGLMDIEIHVLDFIHQAPRSSSYLG
jgi:hypothetical protein